MMGFEREYAKNAWERAVYRSVATLCKKRWLSLEQVEEYEEELLSMNPYNDTTEDDMALVERNAETAVAN